MCFLLPVFLSRCLCIYWYIFEILSKLIFFTGFFEMIILMNHKSNLVFQIALTIYINRSTRGTETRKIKKGSDESVQKTKQNKNNAAFYNSLYPQVRM